MPAGCWKLSLRADPEQFRGAWLAWHTGTCCTSGRAGPNDPAASSAEAARLAERAVMLDPGDARALTLAGHVRGFLGRRPEGSDRIAQPGDRAEPQPGDCLVFFWTVAHVYTGRHARGRAAADQSGDAACRHRTRMGFSLTPGADRAVNLMYAATIPARRRRGGGRSNLIRYSRPAHKGYLAALGMMDRGRAKRRTCWGRLLRTGARLFRARTRCCGRRCIRPQDLDRYADGLRRAGLARNRRAGRKGGQQALLMDREPHWLILCPSHRTVGFCMRD